MKDPLFHHDHDISTMQDRRVVQGRYEGVEAALYILHSCTHARDSGSPTQVESGTLGHSPLFPS